MDTLKDLAAPIEAYVTVAALLVAGFWTWLLFIRERKRYPRVATKLEIEHISLTEDVHLLRVVVRVTNAGTVMVTSPRAELRLFRVVPAPVRVLTEARAGLDPAREEQEIDWIELGRRDWQWDMGRWWGKPGDFEVEPGEGDILPADFTVGADVQVVQLYFFLCNPRKKGKLLWRLWTKAQARWRKRADPECQEEPPYELGWTETTVYRLKEEETKTMASEREKNAPRQTPKQAPQQQPKRPKPPAPARKPSTPASAPTERQQRPKKG